MSNYKEVETIENCTVQILRDSETGKESVAWFRGTEADLKPEHKVTQFEKVTESPEALADFIVSGGKCNKCIIEGCVCDNPNACFEGILKYLESEV